MIFLTALSILERLQPFPQRSVTGLRQRQWSYLAEFELPERAVAGTVAIEKDLAAASAYPERVWNVVLQG